MSATEHNSSNSIGFGGLLALLFITLKLLGKIDWSWWWVLSPFWIPLLVVATIAAVAGAIGLVVWMCS
jgi:hypothetical protein